MVNEVTKNCKTQDDLFGPAGISKQLTKAVLEKSLHAEKPEFKCDYSLFTQIYLHTRIDFQPLACHAAFKNLPDHYTLSPGFEFY
jgi:hypothetical protein